MSHYVLPDLPYDYGALEPHLSGKIMQLHHDKHHRTYVDTANQCIDKLIEIRRKKDFETIAALEHKLAFNVSGHVLHSLFWQNLAPQAGGEPQGELAKAIARDFGSFEIFQQQMIHTAATIMGSGWAALVWDPVIIFILNQPGFAVFGVLAFLLYAIGRRPPRRIGRFAVES